MVLSDRAIRELLRRDENPLIITDLVEGAIQPSSIDVRIAGRWKRQVPPLYVAGTPVYQHRMEECSGPIIAIAPKECILAATIEKITVPRDYVVEVNGKSTWGRLFLSIHQTAGYLDPGFGEDDDGNPSPCDVTLELYNAGVNPIHIEVGKFIAQFVVHRLSSPAEHPYRGRYQGQDGPTEAR